MLNNDERKLTITFIPTSGGLISASLSIFHDASTKSKDVELKGVGVPVARIVLSDNTFDFDKKIINRTHTHDLNIENVGTSDLEINNLSFTGLGAAVYSISAGGPTPINIMPGTSKTITIAFKPIVVGNYAATLEIYHNAVNENSPILYPITGEAIDVDPQITLSQPSPWDFGSVPSNNPAIQVCDIENTGIDPLTVTSATLATGTIFSVDSLKDSNGNVINFPQIIAVGAKIILAVKFAPTATTTYNDTLTLIHDGTNKVSPLDIPITGEGRLVIVKTFNYTGSIENWTVPAGITSVRIEVWGAQGGSASSALGGKGARMRGDFTVAPGDTIKVLAGQQGVNSISPTSSGASGGGGGGSFVATNSNQPLICGGGGGGAGVMNSSPQNVAEGDDGVTGTSGTAGKGAMPFGTNGQGAPNSSNTGASGGAGFLTDSQPYTSGWAGSAKAFINGGAGAIQTNTGGNGGFGGGGAGAYGGGGGGGYSGGAHGHFTPTRDLGAGGGGSINNGTDQDNAPGIQSANGKVTITY